MVVRDKKGRFARYWDVYQGPQVNYQWLMHRTINDNGEGIMNILKEKNPLFEILERRLNVEENVND